MPSEIWVFWNTVIPVFIGLNPKIHKFGSSWFKYFQTTLPVFSCIFYSAILQQSGSSWFKYLQPTLFSCALYSAILWQKWDQADSDIFKPLYFPAFFISRFWDKVGLSWFQYLQTTVFSCVLYSAILRQSGIKLIQISLNHFVFLHSLFCDFETKWD